MALSFEARKRFSYLQSGFKFDGNLEEEKKLKLQILILKLKLPLADTLIIKNVAFLNIMHFSYCANCCVVVCVIYGTHYYAIWTPILEWG